MLTRPGIVLGRLDGSVVESAQASGAQEAWTQGEEYILIRA
jgi:hypothetical protein